MLNSHNPRPESRDVAAEQRVALNLMMTPWVWAMAPAWAWWNDPPPAPRAHEAPRQETPQ